MSALSRSRSASSLVELVFAEDGAQRGLRQLAGRGHKVRDLDDRSLRVDDAEVKDGIDLDRDIVARDHVLRRHVLHHDPQIDLHHLLHERNEDDETGPFTPVKRPSVKTTPRSYSLKMRMAAERNMTTTTTRKR